METERKTTSVTRPADATPYTSGDVVGGVFLFEGLPILVGKGVLIESAVLIDAANQVTRPDLELWLFTVPIADLDADNVPWTPTDAQLLTCVGVIAFAAANFKNGDASAGAAGNCACFVNGVNVIYKGDNLYGVLIVRNAYTPVISETFSAVLNLVR